MSEFGEFTVSVIVFATTSGGALLGLLLRGLLPAHHLARDSQDVVKLTMGLLATMSALVLGLLIASANGSFDDRRTEFQKLAADVVLLDRALDHYGTEADPARDSLRTQLTGMIELVWPRDGSNPQFDPGTKRADSLYEQIQRLKPRDDAQRTLKAEALRLAIELGQMRWLLFEEQGLSIPVPFLVVLIVWLAMLFASFGLFGPVNVTVTIALLLSSVSVASAVFIILELADPFAGVIRISNVPMTRALAHLGQ